MGIYGPRTTYVLALKDIPGTHEFLLLDEGLFWTMSSTFNLATSQYLVLRILNMNIGCVLAKHVFVSALWRIISYGAWILVFFVCGSINCRFVFRKMATCQGHNRNCWRKDVFSWKSESYIWQPRLWQGYISFLHSYPSTFPSVENGTSNEFVLVLVSLLMLEKFSF